MYGCESWTIKKSECYNTMATWCKELTHWKRPWCWERLRAGGEGDDRGWDGWMASPTPWTWVWANSRSWWWTGRPGVLQSMGSQRVGHDWQRRLGDWTQQGLWHTSGDSGWRRWCGKIERGQALEKSKSFCFLQFNWSLYLEWGNWALLHGVRSLRRTEGV